MMEAKLNDFRTYYDVLEITEDASQEEIYQAYQRAKTAYSQDGLALYSLITKEECDQMLVRIEEAYGIISDPQKRIRYDEAKGIRSTWHENHAPQPRMHDNLAHVRPIHSTDQFRPQTQNQSYAPERREDERERANIKKLVASNKFGLQFTPDPAMEQEIEQTTEFTGGFLKKVREYKNVDLVRMSDMTKVSKTYLQNIENEETENLPALVYVRGFVYQYAKCLKLNPDLVATSYIFHLKRLKGEQ